MPVAAIQATYADYRRVKGRKVLQIILEVPLEQAKQVHDTFGEPMPDGSTWVAVALLNKAVAGERKGGKLAQKAGILCNEGGFRRFLSRQYLLDDEGPAGVVRMVCGIDSRADLDHNAEAAKRFLDLVAAYELWLKDAA